MRLARVRDRDRGPSARFGSEARSSAENTSVPRDRPRLRATCRPNLVGGSINLMQETPRCACASLTLRSVRHRVASCSALTVSLGNLAETAGLAKILGQKYSSDD